ncbi:MAG: gliding motility lipoprotein GldH [Bacteroidales bacterium]|nr:gliding motility lipoprotein GldH [Bacteroidales bacterium]
MKKKNILLVISIAFLLLFIVACDTNKKVYEKYHKFDNLSWNRFNILEFEIPIEETGHTYNIYLTIRHIPEFPNKKLLINYAYFMPSGDMRTNDKELKLTNREGDRLSNCLGDFCDIEFLIRKELSFSEPGLLKVEIENKHTKIELPGIIEVGLIIRESN